MNKGIRSVTLRRDVFFGMELFNFRGKNYQPSTIQNPELIRINKNHTKLNTSDTPLTRVLYVATLYFNRILNVQIKANRLINGFNISISKIRHR
jgi:hypothetical protein